MNVDTLFWIIIMALSAVVEMLTTALVSVWFVAGGAAAFLLSLFPVPMFVQWLVFAAVSLAVMILFRERIAARLRKNRVATNADSVIGKIVPLKEAVDNEKETGLLMIGDQEWTARSADPDKTIPAGSRVRILRLEGVKVIVEEAKEQE